MKYKNTQRAIVIIGDRESVQPYGITRDFSPKDMENLPGIDAAVRKGYLVQYEGKDEPIESSASPRAATWQTEMSSGTPVKKKTPGGVVEYVVADTEGCDAVSMSDPDTVTSLSGTGEHSTEYIEEGLSAKQYKHRTASEAFDAEIDKENLDADFNDEDTLAETEQERDNILDADEEIAKDTSQVFVKNAGPKGGSQPQGVQAVVEQATSKALSEVSKANKPDYDEAEVQAGAPAKVVDFLKQNFSAKKWEIAKSSDPEFLREIEKVTQSENIRSLVQQRLAELPKAEEKK
jgi:hypothetical protein